MQDFTVSAREEKRLYTLLLFLLTIVVYLPAVNGGFIWDDNMYITNNRLLRMGDGLKYIWLTPDSTHQYYPLTVSSFWLEFQLWGLWSTGYHLVNILLHITNAVLLFRILQLLVVPGAWFAAAIFALHPVQVESVAWIIERKNVLSGLFYFSAFFYYLHFLSVGQNRSAHELRVWRYYAYAVLLFFCGLWSKTAICSLPLTILVALWWKNGALTKRDLGPILPMLVLAAVMGVVTVTVEQSTVGATGEEWSHTLVEKILIAGRALWFYATKLLFPYNLAFIYPRWSIDATIWSQYLFPLGAAASLLTLILLQKRFGRAPAAAVLFFCITLGPALGFFSIYFMRFSYVADHFQYLASAGLITLFSGLVWNKRRNLANPEYPSEVPSSSSAVSVLFVLPYRTALSALVLLVFGLLTWNQSHLYASPEELWTDTLTKNPKSWLAHNNLGTLLLDNKKYDQAIAHFEQAKRLKPDLVEPQRNLTLAFLRSGNFDAAIDNGLHALRLATNSSLLNSMVGSAFWAKGDVLRAAQHFREAIRQQPVIPEAHYNLGILYIRESVFKDTSPQEAITQLEKAFMLYPESLQFRYTLAWALATFPDGTVRDGTKAMALAKEGCERTRYRNPFLLDALAAAYAESGRFKEAIETGTRAVALAEQGNQTMLSIQISNRLQLYQAGKAYSDTHGQLTSSDMAKDFHDIPG